VRALLLAVGLVLLAGTARGATQPVWTMNTAEVAVQDAFDAGAACHPVGPGTAHGSSLEFGTFACAVFRVDGTEQVLTLRPASAIQLDYRTLHPASGPPPPFPVHPGFVQRIIILNPKRGAVELVDQSVWQVHDPDHKLARWKVGDRIAIEYGTTYGFANLTRHQILGVTFRGFDA
jgi:hypothetical protein